MSATRIITNAWKVRTLPDIFYEEKEREEDSMLQDRPIQRIAHLLNERYEDRPDVFISGEVYVSYDITDGNRRVGPDLFIAFDVNVAGIREGLPNFWTWETGKAPDFVMEVASPSTAENDMGWKRELYRRIGVQEYWRFDPTGGELYGRAIIGERLMNGEYEEYPVERGDDGSARSRSELLDMVFYRDSAGWFDVLDPATGLTIDKRAAAEGRATVAEAELSLEREARVAEQARADAEQARADAAEARVRELEELLRAAEE
ncbi:MAG: Uma2 family endonuclease [Chloroflexota bacterium]|nr:Uma2 family endonuclease [Chloroflexota bacterium]MDE2959797.1 Uma2 family endonuclease [Chloroflexota bacterium]